MEPGLLYPEIPEDNKTAMRRLASPVIVMNRKGGPMNRKRRVDERFVGIETARRDMLESDRARQDLSAQCANAIKTRRKNILYLKFHA